MPYMNIYKMPDGFWHLSEHVKDLNEILESRRLGGIGNDTDPPRPELCRECFKVLFKEVKSNDI